MSHTYDVLIGSYLYNQRVFDEKPEVGDMISFCLYGIGPGPAIHAKVTHIDAEKVTAEISDVMVIKRQRS